MIEKHKTHFKYIIYSSSGKQISQSEYNECIPNVKTSHGNSYLVFT